MLKGKKILLGVTGSIAAYKSANLIRLLVKQEADVKVIMTPAAADFITPLTLSTLSKNPVLAHFQKNETGEWNNHVDAGLWADVFLIAPASANTIAKMAAGICDNLLMATYLSARCPVLFAPAMDVDMLKHPATQNALAKLREYGNRAIDPEVGELASGLVGNGRMAEPETIVMALENFFSVKKKLSGKRALVTAGPTYEAIDPVRFIGNHSSGKMGFAVAEALAQQGAEVDLVAGPTHEETTHPGVRLHPVESAEEMFQACQQIFPSSDIAVFSAAVADFRPLHPAGQKIKKADNKLNLELVKTRDIAAELGKQKKNGQVIVGFALETENERANAEKKLVSKNFDFIVLNSLNKSGAGFGHTTNQVEIISRKNGSRQYALKSKKEVAIDIVAAILEQHE